MKSKPFLILIYALVLVFDVYFSYAAWRAYRQPVVLVEWATASELNTVGFNLYRSAQEQGPFEQINEQLIPSSSDPLAGGKYQYRDAQVQLGQTYYYQLEEVESEGTRVKIGETQGTAARGRLLELGAAVFLGAVCLLGLRYSLKLPNRQAKKAAGA